MRNKQNSNKISDEDENNNKAMQSLQLQQKVESLIKSIIVKHPKIEGDILYLRGVFIDSVTGLNKDYWKVVKKYDKAKQKLKLKEQSGFSESNGSYDRGQVRSPCSRISNIKHQIQSTKQTYYDIDLMAIVLSQAKSIKSIFQQSLKLLTKQQYTKTTTILSIYNAYKQFYKSFKHKHKQYVQNFSYDEKHIHKNSTQMKQRLIQELKRQMQKRKQLQQKLSALENSIQKTLKHKNRQIQRLKIQLEQMKNNYQLQNKQLKTYPAGRQQSVPRNEKKVQRNYEVLSKQNNHPVSHFLSDSQSSRSQKLIQHINESDSEQKEQNSLQSQADSQENSQQNENISRLPNRSNLGKFYMGSDLIKTGKINNSEIIKDTNQKSQKISRNSDKLKLQSRQMNQLNPKRCQQHKMTFGNQHLSGKQQNSNKEQQYNSRRQKLFDVKSLQKQMIKLKQQLQRQREQKQGLKQKIKQSDQQYRKLQQQVNELYKMMNNQQLSQQIKGQNKRTIFEQNKDQKRPNKNQQSTPSKWIKGKRLSKQIKLSKQQQQNKQIDQNYDECEDLEEIIAKAQKSFLHNNNFMAKASPISPIEVINNDNYQISFGDVVSPIGKKPTFNTNNQLNVNKLQSPPKKSIMVKTQSLKSNKSLKEQSRITPNKTNKNNYLPTNVDHAKSPLNKSKNQKQPKQLQKSNLYNQKTQQIIQQQKPPLNKDISSLSIRSYSNNILSPYKNLPPMMSSRNRIQNQMKAQLQQIQQYYAQRVKEKDEEAHLFQQQAQKQKIKGNQLIMMLLNQAAALQEFILNQQLSLQYRQEQN